MRILISIFTLMLAGALASDSYGHGSHGSYGGHGGLKGGAVAGVGNVRDLIQLEKMAHDVAAEKLQLGKRVDMLKNQQSTLLAKIDNLQTVTIPALLAVQSSQDASLAAVRERIRGLVLNVADAVAALDGEAAVATLQESLVNGLWARILNVVARNNAQTALVAKGTQFLAESKELLNTKLAARRVVGEGLIAELKSNTKAFGALVNTRKCYSVVVPVAVNPESHATDVAEYFPKSFFGSLTPTAFCAIVGVSAHLNLDTKKQSAGYGGYGYGYEDKYQSLIASADCKPFNDKILVSVFDQSKGTGNIVDTVFVSVKACTLGPQSSGLKH